MVAGVCAGVAARFGWDVVLVRLALCLSVLVCAGTGLLAYIVAWVVMPNAPISYVPPPSAPDVPMGAQPAA
jgi:phage shock protein PspC (stress-responsive transcriptional regulator)